jgi:hypothetical protein
MIRLVNLLTAGAIALLLQGFATVANAQIGEAYKDITVRRQVIY